MWTYIFKRVLLLIPTLLGILALTFAIIQFVPGGPVEQMVQQLNHGSQGMAEVSSGGGMHAG
ncbi:MAG TPA: microcin ABC transporter permease, partial [Vitreoscilla sp.]|nr:microcin ABC transporter permease [Vitreoscilla sp.]